jgi:4-hydroxy-tetrahydrodipicolinate synthase
MSLLLRGIYAATVCPMLPDGAVDQASLEQHLAAISAVPGLAGLLINGHAGENFTLARAEQRGIVETARRMLPTGAQIVAGVNAEASSEAAMLARDAASAGADAILVFPPFSWALSQDLRVILRHHQIIAEACSLPMLLYQAPVAVAQLAYRDDTLTALLDLPAVAGIKEGSWETAAYEANRRLVHRLRPEVAVMASGDEHLLTCFMLGSEGSLVSLAALAPEPVIALEAAVLRCDMAAARALHDTVYPLARAIYGTRPGGRATARLKACLHMLGRIDYATCRAPMQPLPDAELAMLRRALADAGLA